MPASAKGRGENTRELSLQPLPTTLGAGKATEEFSPGGGVCYNIRWQIEGRGEPAPLRDTRESATAFGGGKTRTA